MKRAIREIIVTIITIWLAIAGIEAVKAIVHHATAEQQDDDGDAVCCEGPKGWDI